MILWFKALKDTFNHNVLNVLHLIKYVQKNLPD